MLKINSQAALDQASNEIVFRKRERVKLEPICVKLLTIISLKKGMVATRQELIDKVWNGNEGVGKTALTKNIYKLRKIFEDNLGENIIETIPTKGYRLKKLRRISGFGISTGMIVKLGIAASILAFIILKLTNPGMFHMISHSMSH